MNYCSMAHKQGRKTPKNSSQEIVQIVQQVLSDGTQHVICYGKASQYRGSAGGISACGLAALNFARIVFAKERYVKGEALLHEVLAGCTVEEVTSICTLWTSSLHLEIEEIARIPLYDKSLALVSSLYGVPGYQRFKSLLLQLVSTSPTNATAAIITRPPEIIVCVKIHTSKGDIFLIFDSHPRPNHAGGAGLIINKSVDAAATYLVNLLAVDQHLLADGANMQWQAQLLTNFSGHIFVPKGDPPESNADISQTVIECSIKILELQAEVSDLKGHNTSLVAEHEKLELDCEKLSDELRMMKMKTPAIVQVGASLLDTPRSTMGTASTNSFLSDPQHLNPEIAIHKQHEFELEDQQLAAERRELIKAAPSLFTCEVCFEEQPEDYIARIPYCSHSFCRDCLRTYIASKLGEHRFPILCPVCVAEAKSEPNAITEELILLVGIPEVEYALFQELQISAYSVLLHCRGCQQSVFVDRSEYQESKILVCPLPGCSHVWCKACQQIIDVRGPQHSCDGSSELNHLMTMKGWRYCPGCSTPIQKEFGCNHMTCVSPGCNTHFCYICGEEIIKSAMAREIKAATSAHYRRCSLFEDVAEP